MSKRMFSVAVKEATVIVIANHVDQSQYDLTLEFLGTSFETLKASLNTLAIPVPKTFLTDLENDAKDDAGKFRVYESS